MLQEGALQLRVDRYENRAELHDRDHRHQELDSVLEHHHDPVARRYPEARQVPRQPVAVAVKRGEGERSTVLERNKFPIPMRLGLASHQIREGPG